MSGVTGIYGPVKGEVTLNTDLEKVTGSAKGTLGELEEAMAAAQADARQRPPGSEEQMKREFLNRFIETRLQLQEADREKIIVEGTVERSQRMSGSDQDSR